LHAGKQDCSGKTIAVGKGGSVEKASSRPRSARNLMRMNVGPT
jgi:hypothetical protein